MLPIVQLKKGKTDSLQRFHPWIFSGAIYQMPENINEGDLVKVVDHKGEFLALGHYQIGSITIRIISFVDIEINLDFWISRLSEAYKLRKTHQNR